MPHAFDHCSQTWPGDGQVALTQSSSLRHSTKHSPAMQRVSPGQSFCDVHVAWQLPPIHVPSSGQSSSDSHGFVQILRLLSACAAPRHESNSHSLRSVQGSPSSFFEHPHRTATTASASETLDMVVEAYCSRLRETISDFALDGRRYL